MAFSFGAPAPITLAQFEAAKFIFGGWARPPTTAPFMFACASPVPAPPAAADLDDEAVAASTAAAIIALALVALDDFLDGRHRPEAATRPPPHVPPKCLANELTFKTMRALIRNSKEPAENYRMLFARPVGHAVGSTMQCVHRVVYRSREVLSIKVILGS